MRRRALGVFSLLLVAAAPYPEQGPQGMVAADHPDASAAGAEILRRGGNAVDAAVATALAAGVAQPAGSGLGGGGFAVLQVGETRTVLDFREVAPAGASKDMYLDEAGEVIAGKSQIGGLANAVPGEPRGLAQLVRERGRLSLSQVAKPAIALARKGFALGDHLHSALGRKPEMVALLFDVAELPPVGERVRRSVLARSITTWARSGGEALSTGALAEDIARASQAAGGVLTVEDLGGYSTRTREPLVGRYRDYTIVTMPPPSSGGAVLLQVLAVLDAHDLEDLGHNSSEHIHLLAESMKHAYADRAAFMGDPDFVDVPVDRMLAPERIQEIQRSIYPTRTLPKEAYGSMVGGPDDAGTQHISVLDGDGGAVALTTTINTSFGSTVVAPRSGILLNNEMDDFVAKPGVPNAFGLVGREANAVEPGKRPLSSMTPTLVYGPDGELVMAVGASGGPFIISSTLQVISNLVDFGMDPEDAVSAARIHHQWVPELLFLDEGIPRDVHANLRSRGHEIQERSFFSAVQVVAASPTGTWGASDPRKGGHPAAE